MMKQDKSNLEEQEIKLSNLLFNKTKNFAAALKSTNDDQALDIDKKPAWVDEDDEESFSKAKSKDLKRRYEVLLGTPSWAKLDKKPKNKDDEEDEEILRTVGHLKKVKSDSLTKDILSIKRCPKILLKTKKELVTCLKFHPTATVALVGGHSGFVSLFSVGGDQNNQLHSFKLHRINPSVAYFTPDGSEAYIASKTNHTYCVYDLIKAEPKLVRLPYTVKTASVFVMSPNGKYLAVTEGFDEVFIISTASKELLRSLKHNSNISSLVFSSDSETLYSYCEHGEVCVWSMSTYRVIKKFFDNGCVTSSCIATSPCGRLLAMGSGEGIVNIYETSKIENTMPLPLKVIQNLKTTITDMQFNSTTELLSISSSAYQNAVKLVHIPSYHVYMNFPVQTMDYGNVHTVSFSPNSGYMAVGNNKSTAYLYRLNHYKNY